MSLLSLEGCAKGFGDRQLFTDLSLTLAEGDRVGLLGRNGCGKSSLLRILAGLDPPDEGTRVARRDLKLGYLEQEPHMDPTKTLREVVREGFAERAQVQSRLARLHEEFEVAGEAPQGLIS